jgi:methionyl-tRNA synthetase
MTTDTTDTNAASATGRRTYIVTSAPPNPNGDLHLGHLSGPFLGADVLTRHLRQLDHEVRYVGYSDEHSCYVPRRAAEIGSTPYETALVFGSRMEETLSLGAMHHDWFTRPLTTPRHTEIVQRYFLALWKQDVFEVRELPVFFCAVCDRYLYEAEVRGECQFCADPSDGIYCEKCGLAQDPAGLAAPKCTACWQAPEIRTMRRIVFPLDKYRDQLLAYYAEAQGKAEWRPRLRKYVNDLFSRPLPATPVSRESDYGIPVPLPEWEGHILDTWFSGIWGYMAATANLTHAEGRPDLWEQQWTDPDTRIVNFIGFDCSFSHAVLWPALLLAHGGLTLPSQVVTNEFYRLEGEKFSTSRGHAIWGGEFLRQVSADALRFHLCLTGPEREQGNFAMKEFDDTVRTVLVDGLEQWVQAVVPMLAEDFESTVPRTADIDGPLELLSQDLTAEVGQALAADSFSPQRATSAIVAAADRAVEDLPRLNELRESGSLDYAQRLATHLEALARLSVVAAPLMPSWSAFIARELGIAVEARTGLPLWSALGSRILPPGTTIARELPLYFHEIT